MRVKPVVAGLISGLAGQVLCPARSNFRSGNIQGLLLQHPDDLGLGLEWHVGD